MPLASLFFESDLVRLLASPAWSLVCGRFGRLGRVFSRTGAGCNCGIELVEFAGTFADGVVDGVTLIADGREGGNELFMLVTLATDGGVGGV